MKIDLKKRIAERRKSARLKISIPVKYKLVREKKTLHETFCRDISGGGLKLNLDCPMKKGQRLKTLIYFPEAARPITALSKVIWRKRCPSGRKGGAFELGIQHVKIDPKDRERFVYLFCEMMLSYFLR